MPDQRGVRYSSARREDILEKLRESGLSASHFCVETGLSCPTLKRWLGPAEPDSMTFVEVESASPGVQLIAAAGHRSRSPPRSPRQPRAPATRAPRWGPRPRRSGSRRTPSARRTMRTRAARRAAGRCAQAARPPHPSRSRGSRRPEPPNSRSRS